MSQEERRGGLPARSDIKERSGAVLGKQSALQVHYGRRICRGIPIIPCRTQAYR
ncbi:hypothetical protein ACFX14_035524 [Malus domestica]